MIDILFISGYGGGGHGGGGGGYGGGGHGSGGGGGKKNKFLAIFPKSLKRTLLVSVSSGQQIIKIIKIVPISSGGGGHGGGGYGNLATVFTEFRDMEIFSYLEPGTKCSNMKLTLTHVQFFFF